jgi:glutamyl-tRNA reductase
VGAGDTGTKAAKHLRAEGVGELVIANRTLSRAQTLARMVDGRPVSLDDLDAELAAADAVVVTATAPSWIVTAARLEAACATRAGSRLVVVDLAVPAAVEPCALDALLHVSIADLTGEVEENRHRREAEIPRVEASIERELDWLRAWARHHALRPLVSDLRRKVEAIRRTEVARAERELQDSGVDPSVLERLTRRLLDQVLGIPLSTLEAGDLPLDAAHAEYLRRLFALDQAGPRCA